jgi:hypothetical protein
MVNFNHFFWVLFLVILLFGCKKDKKEIVNVDTEVATDHDMAEKESTNVLDAVEKTADEKIGKTQVSFLPPCATVTLDTVSATRSLTIDFGNSPGGCLCPNWDNRYRKGKIILTWTGNYRDSASVHNIITENYFVGDGTTFHQYIFHKTVTNNGRNSSGNLYFTVSMRDTIILANNAGTITCQSNKTREWTAGETTKQDPLDDEYKIWGTGSGVTRSGKSYELVVKDATPLHVKLNCKWIVSGIVQITPKGKSTLTLDYGNGNCDSQANVTIDGITYQISLN